MANITSQKWLDLIFANKNKDFGAYQLRKKSAKRHNLAALFTLIGLIVIVGLVIGWSKYSAYRAELLAQAQAEKMRALAEMENKNNEDSEEIEDELILEEPEPEEIPEVEEVLETQALAQALVVDEPDPEQERRSVDDVLESDAVIHTQTQEGTTTDAEKVQEIADKIKTEPQKEEPKPDVKEHKTEEEPQFLPVESQAQFPGGQAALMKWLSNNVKYPESAQQNNVEGRVVVQFIVEKDGSISQAKVVKGVDKDLDKEALRVVNKMPKWQPGKMNGNVVRSIFTLPVVFKLQTL